MTSERAAHGLVALEFEKGFKAIASTKGRLANKSTKSLEGLRKENETLRLLVFTPGERYFSLRNQISVFKDSPAEPR